jgi:hypothetical protein
LTFDSDKFFELDGNTEVLIGINVREKTGTTFIYADDITLQKRPTVAITSNDVASGNSTVTNPITLTFTTSENTNDFEGVADDFTLVNGTLSDFTGSETTYTAKFTVANLDTPSSITVNAGAFSENSFNNIASSTFTYTYNPSQTLTYQEATTVSEYCNSESSSHKITLPFINATAAKNYTVSLSAPDGEDISAVGKSSTSFNNVTSGDITLTNVPSGVNIKVTLNDGTSDFTSDPLNATACSSNDYIGNKTKWGNTSAWTEGRAPNANDDVIVYGKQMWNDGAKDGTKKNAERIDFDEAGEVRDITFKLRMDIKSGGSLKCRNITLENDYNQLSTDTNSNGKYASLIYTGTLTKSDNCNIAYTRYVAETKNDLISSPFDNEKFYDFIRSATTNKVLDSLVANKTTGIAPYSNSNKNYVTWNKSDDGSKFELGKGYAIGVKHKTETVNGKTNTYKQVRFNSKYPDNAALNLASNTLDKKVSLDKSDINGTDNPWNLIGNPYLAYYNLAEFLSDNAGAIDDSYEAIYGYNDGTFDTYNSSNAGSRHIAPGTAFFVAAATSSSEITFKPGNRKTYTESANLGSGDDFNSARASNTVERFDLVILEGDNKFKTNFYFDNNVTAGLDSGYDAGSFNAKSQNLAIYSLLADNSSALDLSIQALPLDQLNNQIVKLGVNAKAGYSYSINIDNNSFTNQSIFLTDHETNQVFDLTKGAYNFSVNTDLEGTERFEISFQSEALSQQESLLNQFQVVTQNHTITVIGNIEANTSLKVYDLQGRIIVQKLVSNDSRELRLDNQNAGVYVLSISNTNGQRTQKVILK